MFSFPIIEGNVRALDEPYATVISSQMATKYFGSTNPIGRTLEIVLNDSSQVFVVGAVINTHRERSSLDLNVLVSFDVFAQIAPGAMTSYKYASIESYIVLENPDVVEGISPVLTSALPSEGEEDTLLEIGIQSLFDIHLNPSIVSNASNTTTPEKLYIISALGFLVLLVAVINFITLSTSHSLKRLKEIGLRKTLGAIKTQIRGQLIVESFFVSLTIGFRWCRPRLPSHSVF